MKIGFDAKRAFNNRSGLGNYSRDVIRAMIQKQSDELFLFTTKTDDALFNPKGATVVLPQKKLEKIFRSYWRTFEISKKIEELKLDIFHGLSNEIPFGIKSPAKTLITVHDLIFKRFPQWYPYFDRIIYDKKIKYGVNSADKIIAVSQQTKRDIIDFYHVDESKIEVVYQTCNDIFKKKTSPATIKKVRKKYNLPAYFLLYVGTIEPRKNALNIVKAIHRYKIDIPLVLIGRSTPYADKIKRYIRKNGLENQVMIFHNVATYELPVFYQEAEIFIYPSIFEGFGIPIIEALYSGTPVITTKYGCFVEAGGKFSKYIDPENVEELGEAVKSIINNRDIRSEMIRKGLAYVKKFDAEKVTQDLYKVYLSLLK